jgi:3-isopropylmalate dehydrogenase
MESLTSRLFPDRPVRGERIVGVLPGEGIGPEIIAAALDVLAAVDGAFEVRTGGAIGLPALEETGRALTPEVVSFCEEVFADRGAILCGPGGARFVYDLRARFDLFCKLTPVRPIAALDDTGVLRPEARAGVDLLVVRENSGGLYFGEWGSEGAAAFQQFRYEEGRVARLLDVAVRAAELRRGRLCLVVKPEGIPAISELWQSQLTQRAAGHAVETRVLEVDHASYQLIADARSHDVIVAPNLFGDILSDCAALLLGSRGLSYSGNFGPGGAAVYQTGHGAARELAGTDRANPLGQVFSLAMLLRESCGLADAADAIEEAAARTVAAGWRTADVAGPGSRVIGTREMGRRVAEALA